MKRVLGCLRRELRGEILFDQGVEVARNACVAGAPVAAAAIGIAAYSGSPLVGLAALRECMGRLERSSLRVASWIDAFRFVEQASTSTRLFAPGFGYIRPKGAARVRRACRLVAVEQLRFGRGRLSEFYSNHHAELTEQCGPLNAVGLMALVFLELGLSRNRAERFMLVWQVERAVIEAQRVQGIGAARYPFLSEAYCYEGSWPAPNDRPVDDYPRRIGLFDEEEA